MLVFTLVVVVFEMGDYVRPPLYRTCLRSHGLPILEVRSASIEENVDMPAPELAVRFRYGCGACDVILI